MATRCQADRVSIQSIEQHLPLALSLELRNSIGSWQVRCVRSAYSTPQRCDLADTGDTYLFAPPSSCDSAPFSLYSLPHSNSVSAASLGKLCEYGRDRYV